MKFKIGQKIAIEKDYVMESVLGVTKDRLVRKGDEGFIDCKGHIHFLTGNAIGTTQLFQDRKIEGYDIGNIAELINKRLNICFEMKDMLKDYGIEETDFKEEIQDLLSEIFYNGGQNEDIHVLQEKNKQLKQWINDLQSGMYVNCVYCGHRYGPEGETPTSMADALKEHIENCPNHPMSELKQQIKELTRIIARNLVAWDTSKDKKESLLPEVYISNQYLYEQLTGVKYNFSDAIKRFNIG